MSVQDLFERILASFHEAVFDDERWPVTSGLVDKACGSKGNALVTGDGAFPSAVDIFFARFCYRGRRRQDLEQLYFGTYHAADERLPRLRQSPDSRIVHVESLFSSCEKKTSPMYNEALALAEMRDSLNVRLDGPRDSRIVLVAADPVDGDGWSSERTRALKWLLPHLRHYVHVRQALLDSGAFGSSVATLIETSRDGVIQLDRRGSVVAASDAALGVLRREDALRDRNGFLQAIFPEDNEVLQELLARALPPFGGRAQGGSVTLRREPLSSRLVLHVQPVGGGRHGARVSRVAAIVLVVDPMRRSRIDPALVAETFGLTAAQSQVAVLLAQGHSVQEIARTTGRTAGTIRWHTKRIFREHGIAGQAELIRLVLSLASSPPEPF